jgi:hypothetical protein
MKDLPFKKETQWSFINLRKTNNIYITTFMYFVELRTNIQIIKIQKKASTILQLQMCLRSSQPFITFFD